MRSERRRGEQSNEERGADMGRGDEAEGTSLRRNEERGADMGRGDEAEGTSLRRNEERGADMGGGDGAEGTSLRLGGQTSIAIAYRRLGSTPEPTTALAWTSSMPSRSPTAKSTAEWSVASASDSLSASLPWIS